MSPLKVVAGFAPWIVYLIVVSVAGPRGVLVAALLALLVALGLIAGSLLSRRTPKLLAVAAAVIFVAYAVASLAAPGLDPFLALYGRALAAVLLAAIILVLLPVMPFTEQFSRESVPRQYWPSQRFRATNRTVSAVWAGAIGGSGIANALSVVLFEGAHDAHRGALPLLLRIGVPVVLFLGAIRATRRAVSSARGTDATEQPTTGHQAR